LAAAWCDGTKVKVLLQDIETLEFLRWDGDWTGNSDEALDLFEVVHAVDYAFDVEAAGHGLGAVRVLIKFGDSRHDLQLPALHSVA